MNLLKGTRAYLVGPIENSDDPNGWRGKMTEELNELGVKVYDPMIKPKWSPSTGTAKSENYLSAMNGKRENETDSGPTQERMKAFSGMKWIRDIDRRYVHSSDFIICYLPKEFSVGSIEELTIAAGTGKPVLLFSDDGIPSSWLVNILCEDYSEMANVFFEDAKSVVWYLNKLNMGDMRVDPLKWIFLTHFNQDMKVYSQ